jgi:hypothetical protein
MARKEEVADAYLLKSATLHLVSLVDPNQYMARFIPWVWDELAACHIV